MSARLFLPRAVVGGARVVAQRVVAWLVFGTQALLSPGVMRPCRLASDGSSFSLVVGSPSSCRAMFAFVALIFLRFLGPSDAATSVAASLEQ